MTTTTAEVLLTAMDRCDRCGAAAKVRAELMNGELLFCGHHAKEYRAVLQKASLSIYDPEEVYGG